MNWRRSLCVTDLTASMSSTDTSSETKSLEYNSLVLRNDLGSYVNDGSSSPLAPAVTNR